GTGVHDHVLRGGDPLLRETRPDLLRGADRPVLVEQVTHRDIDGPRDMPRLEVEDLPAAGEAAGVPGVHDTAPAGNMVQDVVDLRDGQLTSTDLPADRGGEVARPTDDGETQLIPEAETTVEDLHVRDARPAQDPPRPGGHEPTALVVDHDAAVRVEPPP